MVAYPTDALQAMKTLAFQGVPLSLVGSFKGMHFYDQANPIQVGRDHVVLRTPGIKVCLTMHDKVYIYNRLLPETIRAVPQMLVNMPGTIRLSDFAYTGSLWYDRQGQRVQPGDALPAEVMLNGVRHEACIQDISLQGTRLWVDVEPEADQEVIVNLPVTVILPVGEVVFVIRGQIANRHFPRPHTLSLGVRLRPTVAQQTWLRDYIARRQRQILAELDTLVNEQLEPQGIQAQYF